MFGLIRLLVAEQQERVERTAHWTHRHTYLYLSMIYSSPPSLATSSRHWCSQSTAGGGGVGLVTAVAVAGVVKLLLLCCGLRLTGRHNTALCSSALAGGRSTTPHTTHHTSHHTNMYHLYRVQCICMILSWV